MSSEYKPTTVPNRTLGSSATTVNNAGSALIPNQSSGLSSAINGFNSMVSNNSGSGLLGGIGNMIGNVASGSGIFGSIAGVITGELGNVLGNVLGFPTTGVDSLVRIGFKSGHPYSSYPGILSPLAMTGGVVFPYRPTIDISRSVNYDAVTPIHSMQDFKSFRSNSSVALMVSGQYAVQSVEEARYLMAVLHFFKTASLMSFGTGGAVPAGMPPPVLNFSAYGPTMAQNVPVVLDAVAQSFPNDVDYVRVDGSSVPTLMTVTCNMSVQLSPNQLRNFNLDAFAQGAMQSYI